MASWGGARPNSGPKKGPDGRALKAKKRAVKVTATAVDSDRVAAAVAGSVKAEPRRPMFSDESVQAILRAVEERQLATRRRPRTPDWNPFIIRPERFGPVHNHIKKHRPRLAMDRVIGLDDSNQVAVQAWQTGGLIGNAVAEGLLFLGYPFLSELAQRPEFRLFGEIRAQEMTRKWIEFRAVQDESTKSDNDKGKRNEQDEERAREKRKVGDEKPRTDDRNKEIEDKIKELDDAMDDFRVRDWFKVCAEQDSYFGISHLYLDLKGTDPENIRDPELPKSIGNGRDKTSKNKIGKGCLRSMRAIEPIWVYPTTYNAQNPLLASWYDPQVWYVMGTEIHKTRLLTFIGRPVPDILKPAYAFGGLSMTQMAQPYVDIWLRTRESVGEIIHAFSVMVLMTNLATTTMPGGSGGGGGDVLARLGVFNFLRDNQGVFAVDKQTEDFKNVAAPISGLDELQSQAQEHMFSVGRIPAVKFAGIQPKGLNATSEGEMRAFYDTIVGEQNHLFRPNLNTVADIIQIHLWGACDHDITYDFVELMEQTKKEKAEIRKMDAETSQILIDSGQIDQEEGRRRLALDPESGYHGIDPDDVPELLEEEEEGLVPPGAGRSLEGIVGEKESGKPPAKGSKSVVPFARSRGRDAADDAPTREEARRQAIVTAGGEDQSPDKARPAIASAKARDRLGFHRGLRKIVLTADRDQWNGCYLADGDRIVLQAKLWQKGDQEQVRTILHEFAHRGHHYAGLGLFEQFKQLKLGTIDAFRRIANAEHLEDYAITGKVDDLESEVFAESYARFCLGMPLPDELAAFWQQATES